VSELVSQSVSPDGTMSCEVANERELMYAHNE